MGKFAAMLAVALFGLFAPAVPVGSAESGRADELVTLETELSATNSTLFSVPLDVGSMDVGQWLVEKGLSPRGMHGWNAQAQNYGPLGAVRPGEGFLLARGPGKVTVQGTRVVADFVELPLAKGWNLLGVPYESGIPLAALRITLDGKTESYAAAVERKWVGGVNALVNGALTPLAAEGKATLEPWRGYWFYAFQPCQLRIPSPQSLALKGGGKAKPAK